MDKQNLSELRFFVWSKTDDTGDPLCMGTEHEIVKCLEENGTENLEVAASIFNSKYSFYSPPEVTGYSFDPIPADKWLKWYDYFVIPTLKENDWDRDIMIEYPDAGIDLTDL